MREKKGVGCQSPRGVGCSVSRSIVQSLVRLVGNAPVTRPPAGNSSTAFSTCVAHLPLARSLENISPLSKPPIKSPSGRHPHFPLKALPALPRVPTSPLPLLSAYSCGFAVEMKLTFKVSLVFASAPTSLPLYPSLEFIKSHPNLLFPALKAYG